MKSETPENKKSNLKWLKRTGIVLAVLFLAPALLFTIGWFNRDFLIDELQDWYRENNRGSLEIGEVDATFLNGFPNVGFTIEDIYQTSFDTILDKKSSIFIKKTQVTIAASDLLSGDIQFRNIEIDKARIYSEVISEKTLAQYIELKKEKQSSPNSGLDLPPWLHPDRTNFRLKDVKFVSKDTMLNKYFDLEIYTANGKIRRNSKNIIGSLDFNLQVNDLGFNTRKGSYINGALVSGSPKFVLNRQQNMLSIPQFLLEVGSQTFITKADFNFKETNNYNISLQNPETNFQELKKLLPDSISVKLSAYELLQSIATRLTLDGEFRYGNVPFIEGDFSTVDNQLRLRDSLEMTGVQFSGYLTNTLDNAQPEDQQQPSKKDIKIFFEDFKGSLEKLKISARNSYFQSSEQASNFVDASLKMSGSNESLTRLLQTDNFDFIGGNFNLDTQISGDISGPEELFNYATGKFTLNDTRVVLQKNNLQLPLEILDLTLNKQNSALEKLKIDLPNGEHLVFKGKIKNISSLLANDPKVPASADVTLDSEQLNINELVATAMEFIPPSDKEKNKSNTLHETFEALYRKFQPRFKINLNSVQYDSIRFNDLVADIHFLNSETVQLDQLSFNYNNAVTDLKGTLKIPKPDTKAKEPLFLNVAANSSGPIKVFQDLFNIQLLDIKAGEFGFSGNVTGNIQKFEQLLSNANGDLKLKNAKFFYPKADLDIELDSLKVAVHDAEIILDRFVIEVGDHHPFALQSRITEFPGFLLDNVESKGKIYLGLDAELVSLDDWMKTVRSVEADTTSRTLKNRELAAIFNDIYKFDPEFSLNIDSLKYKDLVTEDITAKVYFENDSILKLKDFSIQYEDSEAVVNGMLAAHYMTNSSGKQNPFNFEFSAEAKGKSRDLNRLLQTVNFTLRSGDFELEGSYKGQAQDLKILNSNVRGDLRLGETMVDIATANIQIPVDSLHLQIENNLATLDRLDVKLPGKSSIDITGRIDNFSNFINNDQAIDSHNSTFIIRSPHLDSKDIKQFLGNTNRKKDSTKKENFNLQDLKEILHNINNSYFPSASINIDSLVYNDIAVSGFTSEIGFNDSGDIKIEDTELSYFGGSVALMLQAGVASPEGLPAKIVLNIKNIDLEKLVKDLDYFNYDELQQAEKINGNLDLVLDISGVFNDRGKLKMESLNGTVQVDLQELAIYDFKPIMENVVLLKDERFEKLQFRPIQQTFKVVEGNIEIPRTQIQSSALQLFVEGQLKIGEYINLWISLPWNNIFKSRDGLELPQKISFEKSGAKFYLQIVQDKENEKERKRKLKTKFRLGNRKLKKSKEN